MTVMFMNINLSMINNHTYSICILDLAHSRKNSLHLDVKGLGSELCGFYLFVFLCFVDEPLMKRFDFVYSFSPIQRLI